MCVSAEWLQWLTEKNNNDDNNNTLFVTDNNNTIKIRQSVTSMTAYIIMSAGN